MTAPASEGLPRAATSTTAVERALSKEWFYRDPDGVPDRRVLDEMIAMLVQGLSGRQVTCDIDETDAGRVRLSGADPATLLRGASDRLASHGNSVDALRWQDGRLEISYPPPGDE